MTSPVMGNLSVLFNLIPILLKISSVKSVFAAGAQKAGQAVAGAAQKIGQAVAGAGDAGPVLPKQLPILFGQTTKKTSVSMGFPGPM